MKARMKLIGIVALLTAFFAFLLMGCGNAPPEDNETDVFVPVTNITGVKTNIIVGTVYLGGTVVPDNATNKTIIWDVLEGDDTGATIQPPDILKTKVYGDLVVMATVYDGKAEGKDYTKEFHINVDPFVPVTNIESKFSGPSKVKDETDKYIVGELYLDGNVIPADASYTDIEWTVKKAGTTYARIPYGDDTLTTKAAGTVVITATIINGKADLKNYTQDFKLEITEAK